MDSARAPFALRVALAALIAAAAAGPAACAAVRPTRPAPGAAAAAAGAPAQAAAGPAQLAEALRSLDREVAALAAIAPRAVPREIDVRSRAALRALADALDRLPVDERVGLLLAADEIRDTEALMAAERGIGALDAERVRHALDVAATALAEVARREPAPEARARVDALGRGVRAIDPRRDIAAQRPAMVAAFESAADAIAAIAR